MNRRSMTIAACSAVMLFTCGCERSKKSLSAAALLAPTLPGSESVLARTSVFSEMTFLYVEPGIGRGKRVSQFLIRNLGHSELKFVAGVAKSSTIPPGTSCQVLVAMAAGESAFVECGVAPTGTSCDFAWTRGRELKQRESNELASGPSAPVFQNLTAPGDLHQTRAWFSIQNSGAVPLNVLAGTERLNRDPVLPGKSFEARAVIDVGTALLVVATTSGRATYVSQRQALNLGYGAAREDSTGGGVLAATIPPEGGTLTVPGVGDLVFPAGAFAVATDVRAELVTDLTAEPSFASTALFAPRQVLPAIRIFINGDHQPATDVKMTFFVPQTDGPAVASGKLMVQYLQGNADESMPTFGYLRPAASIVAARLAAAPIGTVPITAAIPPWVFSSELTPGTQQTVVGFVWSSLLDAGVPVGGGYPCYDGELTTPIASPVFPLLISDGLGIRVHPVTGVVKCHAGIDISVPEGSPVYAAAAGVVGDVGANAFNGNYVFIDHPSDLQIASISRYLHLLKVYVTKGQVVRANQLVALSGQTGQATGPHLHFEYSPIDFLLDPIAASDPVLCSQDRVDPSSCFITNAESGRISLVPGFSYLRIGDQAQMQASFVGSRSRLLAENVFAWQTRSPGVVSVGPTGIVTAVSVGRGVIEVGLDGATSVTNGIIFPQQCTVETDPIWGTYIGRGTISGGTPYDGTDLLVSLRFDNATHYSGGIALSGGPLAVQYALTTRSQSGTTLDLEWYGFGGGPSGVTNAAATLVGNQFTGYLDWLGGRIDFTATYCRHPGVFVCND